MNKIFLIFEKFESEIRKRDLGDAAFFVSTLFFDKTNAFGEIFELIHCWSKNKHFDRARGLPRLSIVYFFHSTGLQLETFYYDACG